MMTADAFANPPPQRSWWTKTGPVLCKANALFHKTADLLTPVADFLARYWVAAAFFSSGLTKTVSGSFTLFGHSFSYPLSLLPTETTFTLFEYEYHVPLLPSALAAYMGTATELLLPVFLFTSLGVSAFAIGLLEGAAEATALIVKVFSGALSDSWGRRKPLAVLGYVLGAAFKPLFAMAGGFGLA